MNLWLVTYEGDLTQFLIEGTDNIRCDCIKSGIWENRRWHPGRYKESGQLHTRRG